MCLVIKNEVPPHPQYRSVYKIYRLRQWPDLEKHTPKKEAILRKGFTAYSFFQRGAEKLKVGWTIFSDRFSRVLAADELSEGKVYRGIHVYLDLQDLLNETHYHNALNKNEAVIVECHAHREDLVAEGTFDEICPSAVYMKVTPKRIVRYYRKKSVDK